VCRRVTRRRLGLLARDADPKGEQSVNDRRHPGERNAKTAAMRRRPHLKVRPCSLVSHVRRVVHEIVRRLAAAARGVATRLGRAAAAAYEHPPLLLRVFLVGLIVAAALLNAKFLATFAAGDAAVTRAAPAATRVTSGTFAAPQALGQPARISGTSSEPALADDNRRSDVPSRSPRSATGDSGRRQPRPALPEVPTPGLLIVLAGVLMGAVVVVKGRRRRVPGGVPDGRAGSVRALSSPSTTA
jgi:hypothetical protein